MTCKGKCGSAGGSGDFRDITGPDVIQDAHRVQVIAFSDGDTIKFGDSGDTHKFRFLGEAWEGPWDKVFVPATTTLRVWKSGGKPLATPTPIGTDVLEKGQAVNVVVPGAITQLLAHNSARRTLGLQNQGTNVVKVCSDVAGTKVIATLAACAAVYDGTGGTFSLNGWTGPLYAIAVGGASDVSVVAY